MSTARICIPICAQSWAELEKTSRQATEYADLIELRLDYLAPEELKSHNLEALIRSLSRPVILTFRPRSQGGFRDLTDEERISFWRSVTEHSSAQYWDLEWDFLDRLLFKIDWSRVIVSHHDFDSVPDGLNKIIDGMASTSAAIVKIAVNANDVVDCLPIFKLIESWREEHRSIIAIAMGNAGLATRVLGPSRGGFLTYAAFASDSKSAPGQLTATQLKSIYRFDEIIADTPVYGLVGLPVMQSVSPHMHNAAFARHKLPGVYLPFEVKDIGPFFRRMVHPRTRESSLHMRGLSITAPYKTAALEWVDRVAGDAVEIGAINTVVVDGDQLVGHNTDAAGLLSPLFQRFSNLNGLKVAIIGAGGVAKSAVWALQKEKAEVTIVARDIEKAQSLADRFGTAIRPLAGATFGEFEIVINATPLGSFGKLVDQTPVTSVQLEGVRCAYDLIYNPLETKFIREACAAGCETIGGLEMLVAQARLQFKLWTGELPSTQVMFDAAMSVLSASGSADTF
jgi:3-dehydroquinate dehydratase/shikimate dehydrogenase